MLTNRSTATKSECFRCYWPVINHKLARSIGSGLYSELINSRITIKPVRIRSYATVIGVDLKPLWTCWSIIDHKLTWSCRPIFQSIHIWSTWPIIHFKLLWTHWPTLTTLLHCLLLVAPKLHKLRFFQIIFRVFWSIACHKIVIHTTTHTCIRLIHIVWICKLLLRLLLTLLMPKSIIVCVWSFHCLSKLIFLDTLMKLISVDCIAHHPSC